MTVTIEEKQVDDGDDLVREPDDERRRSGLQSHLRSDPERRVSRRRVIFGVAREAMGDSIDSEGLYDGRRYAYRIDPVKKIHH